MQHRPTFGLRFKVFFVSFISIFATVAIFFGVSLYAFDSLLEKQEKSNLEAIANAMMDKLSNSKQFSLALAHAYANLPEVQKSFAAQNRHELIDLLHASYQKLAEDYDIVQGQFHIPPATSFLRLHELDKYGDDLSSFRKTVVTAIQTRQEVAGLEKGKGGKWRKMAQQNYESTRS
jgi:methyl-accepting chemotaxis protein